MSVQWRTWRSLGALAASLLTAALVTAPGASTASAASCELWTGVPPPSPGATENELDGMRALGPCNVWAVGFYQNVTNGQILSLAEHWNGTAWKVMSTPSPDSDRNVLSAVGAATINDAWAVGQTGSNTFILHWNGSFWTQAPSPSPSSNTNDLFGVTVVSATDAWAVGQYFPSSTTNPLVLHWDGQQWTQTAAPHPGTDSVLEAVMATSAQDVWAVGGYIASSGPKTLIEHWNGTKWVQVPSPNPAGPVGEIDLFGVAATSASNAWAVGTYSTGTTDKTLIEHWNGHAWTLVPSPNPAPRNSLLAVAATSAGNVWAVGTRTTSATEQTLIVRWNGTAWKPVPSPSPGQVNELTSVATTSATDVWAAGFFTTGGVSQVLAAHCG